jgi:co-chaperonin GroES (HSP10)
MKYMSKITQSPFKANPGFIICIPYIDKEDTFTSLKETNGECQVSEVIAVGDEYKDDHGNLRTTPVKVGDKILHFWATNTFTLKFDKYRAVHFSQVIGIMK